MNKYYNINSEILEDNGKPYIKDNEIYFSISHSKNLLALAFDRKTIGIDIEYKRKRDYIGILKYFKINTIKNISQDDFFKIWTTYEAEYKSRIGGNIYTFNYDNFMCSISSISESKPKIYSMDTNLNTTQINVEFLNSPTVFIENKKRSFLIKYFERYFREEILERGKLLYDAECITYLYMHKNQLHFYVQGTNEYTVIITVDEKYNIINWECNCLYAQKDLCKHVAACLYFIRDKLKTGYSF